MSYQEVMNVILPSQGKTAAHITGHYGEVRSKGPHGGSDFNYVGGQSGANLTHPSVHAPITGEVTFVGGNYGTIKIRDAAGNSHEILHTQTQSVKVGQHIQMGDEIGHMGGRGPKGAGQYDQHVHYQMKDPQGHPINPETFWRDRSPGSPAHADTTRAHAPATPTPATLRNGDKGDEVKALQESLNRLGYRDANGHPLKPDGHFGQHTLEAVERLQKTHGLQPDGIVGRDTQKALTQDRNLATLDTAAHPNHDIYRQAADAVRRLDAEHGRISDESSRRLAGVATAEALKQGLSRVDHVVTNDDGSRAYAVQGDLDSPFKKVAAIDMQKAMETPIEKSSELAAQQHVNQHDLVAQQSQQQTQQQNQQMPR